MAIPCKTLVVRLVETPRPQGRAISPDATFIDSIKTLLNDIQTCLASAYIALKTMLDRLIACEPNHCLASLECRMTRMEEFERRLEDSKSKYYDIKELERRASDLEYMQDDIRGPHAGVGAIITLLRMEEHIRISFVPATIVPLVSEVISTTSIEALSQHGDEGSSNHTCEESFDRGNEIAALSIPAELL
ncbi:hypothetical protein KSP39_PZI022128 [Platanthera zijinensis]|uniref:Uncharacterized protein n=1 Tax=Platanthera zijinensis TaxID=2320716 RepID=A0AAP0AY67_9ASPA